MPHKIYEREGREGGREEGCEKGGGEKKREGGREERETQRQRGRVKSQSVMWEQIGREVRRGRESSGLVHIRSSVS